MVNFLIRRLGALYAHKIGQWLAVMVTMGVLKFGALLISYCPWLAHGWNPVEVTNWILIFAVAPAINRLGNIVAKTNTSEGQVIEEVAADVQDEQPTAKATPVK